MEIVHDKGPGRTHPAQDYIGVLGYELKRELAENDGLYSLR
jgi:hypothetical protein